MIFVTVGTDLPFDRLIKAVDRWSVECGRTDIFAQIGHGGWKPSNFDSAEFLNPDEFKQRLADAEMVIAHAGMGTILSALRAEKPILVMPRRAALGEQRNEHQMATARELSRRNGIEVAYDEEELLRKLRCPEMVKVRPKIADYADEGLSTCIRSFILGSPAESEIPSKVAA